MLWKLAWRNIWRNKRRSMIVMIAIMIGLILLVLTESIYTGVMNQMLENQIGSYITHIQIHGKGFRDNRTIKNTVPDAQLVESTLRAIPDIKDFSGRVLSYGILSSASNSSGISLVGVDPDEEARVSIISQWMIRGTYLTGKGREIIIGRKLAEKLDVDVGDKLVLMASAMDGTVGSDVFRVCGLFRTSSAEFDRSMIYIPIQYARDMLGLGDRLSEYAVLLHRIETTEAVKQRLQRSLGRDVEVLGYADVVPSLIMLIEIAEQSMFIYYLIIGIATIFGIVNTMLMSVFERIREFGVLMAMGMRNGKLFRMILLEAFFLGIIGSLAGIAIGLIIYLPLSSSGINLGSLSEGMTMVGASAVIYPVLTLQGMLHAISIIPFISVLASLYPAWKATRLVPVEAIHYV